MSINKRRLSIQNSEALRILDEIMSEPIGYEDLSEETRKLISKKEFDQMSDREKQEVITKDTEEFVNYINSCRFSLGTQKPFETREQKFLDYIKKELAKPADPDEIEEIRRIFKDFNEHRFKLD